MAAPTVKITRLCYCRCFTAFVVICHLLACISYVACSVSYIEPNDVIRLVDRHCVVVLFTKENQHTDDVYLQLKLAFRKEERVALGRILGTPDEFYWSSDEPLQWVSKPNEPNTIAVFKQKVVDRTCLSEIPNSQAKPPRAEAYQLNKLTEPDNGFSEPYNIRSVLEFVNVKCDTYRDLNGELSVTGLHREHIRESLFHVGSISNFTVAYWNDYMYINASIEHDKDLESVSGFERTFQEDGVNEYDDDDIVCPASMQRFNNVKEKFGQSQSKKQKMPRCERISIPTWKTFFNDYMKRSRPVIIKDALRDWLAMTKWSTEYLRNLYGHTNVHIKLAPDGNFEGVDKSSHWADYDTFKIPKKVKDNIPYPDLVVVRPATMNVNFTDFLDMMSGNSSFIKTNSTERVSAYLEYSSIKQYLPELEKDIEPFPFVNNNLKRRHLNIWLSDGNTLGKLHFDPFDNLLCQIRGKKELTLFEPHDNTKMYEAHIPEALLGYSPETGTFRRKTILDSTSMVMAPVDILEPDLERFPNFAQTHPLNCTIGEGDVLYMPAYWWHEVQSYPNVKEHRNVAVNFWIFVVLPQISEPLVEVLLSNKIPEKFSSVYVLTSYPRPKIFRATEHRAWWLLEKSRD